MKRRAMLILGTLAALATAYLVSDMLTVKPTAREVRLSEDQLPSLGNPTSAGVHGPIVSGTRLRLPDRDPQDGRLKAVYEADSAQKTPEGSYALLNPTAEFYGADGRQTTIRGDRGSVFAEEVRGQLRVQRGRLEGNVEIIFDRSTDAQRAPVNQRPRDVVRIKLDDISFDRDRMEISTPNRVELTSAEMDVTGRDLLIRLARSPDELRLLRLAHGERMVVKDEAQGVGQLQLLRGDQASRAPTAEQAATMPAPREPLKPLPANVDEFLATFPGLVPASAPSTQPTTQKAPAKNVFLVDFVGLDKTVNIDSPTGKLAGARKLTLVFEWDRTRSRSRSGASTPKPAGASPHTGDAPATTAQPTVITWSGPLELSPLGRVETAQRRWVAAAAGEGMTLSDQQATARCDRFVYFYPQQAGQLEGSGAGASVAFAEGQMVQSAIIRFDRPGAMADMLGPGLASAPAGRSVSLSGTRATTAPTSIPADARDVITWRDKALIDLAEYPRTSAAAGGRGFRTGVRAARIYGQPRLVQGASGDSVECENVMEALLTPRPEGGFAPVWATADGSVVVRQPKLEFRSARAGLQFTGGEVSSLSGDGDVVLIDGRQEPALEVRADTLRANQQQRHAVLTGTRAGGFGVTMARGGERLEGNEIRLYEGSESVYVEGPGRVRFTVDRDLDGKPTEPRPMDIVWTRNMQFVGERDTADFFGDVVLKTAQETFEGQHVQAKLTRDELKPQTRPVSLIAAGTSAPPAPKPKPAVQNAQSVISMQGYSGRRLAQVRSDKGVKLQRTLYDQDNNLLQRMTLTGHDLTYSVVLRTANIVGTGRLLLEDYRPPKQRAAGESGSTGADSPSQTIFEWHKNAQLAQEQRWVMMEGGVGMVHVSGTAVVPPEGTAVPSWGTLASARRSGLTAGKLEVTFAPPAGTAAPDKAPPAGELALAGPMRQFIATDSVNLKDERSEIQAQRLHYDRDRELAVAYGYIEGQPKARAVVIFDDPGTKSMRTVTSPEMVCYLKDGRIVRVDASKAYAGGTK
jgi:hypothetical protein